MFFVHRQHQEQFNEDNLGTLKIRAHLILEVLQNAKIVEKTRTKP